MVECKKCGQDKPLEYFIKDRTRKSGHHPYCKVCQNKIKNNKKALKRALNWQKENKDKRKIITKRWRDNNPELCRIYRHKRRLLESTQSDGTITKESLSKLNKEHCYICGGILRWDIPNSVHLDHITPLSKGGLHSINNVNWSCSTCNLSKGNK